MHVVDFCHANRQEGHSDHMPPSKPEGLLCNLNSYTARLPPVKCRILAKCMVYVPSSWLRQSRHVGYVNLTAVAAKMKPSISRTKDSALEALLGARRSPYRSTPIPEISTGCISSTYWSGHAPRHLTRSPRLRPRQPGSYLFFLQHYERAKQLLISVANGHIVPVSRPLKHCVRSPGPLHWYEHRPKVTFQRSNPLTAGSCTSL